MRKIHALVMSFCLSLLVLSSVSTAAMMPMSDGEMSAQTGQALFMMDKLLGDGTSGSSGNGQSGITFYKMGLDAVVDINANIKKLQLGCGGINGNGCDIDIDNMSLSGSDSCSGGRVGCDFQLFRPFVQFAVKNDNNPATRQIVGWRLSAEKAMGLLTAGYQDSTMTDAASLNGINSLSGYLNLQSATGTASTASRQMCYATSQCTDGSNGLNTAMTGRLYANLSLGTSTADFTSNTYRLTLQSASANVTTNPQQIYGKRMSSVNLTGSATIAPLSFSGTMQANVNILGGISLQENVTGTIQGLTATVPITESLGYIHKIQVNNPMSLSLQQQNLLWPKAAQAAMTGWWMAFEDPINIGSITPASQVALTDNVLLQALTGASASPWTTINTDVNGNTTSCPQGNISCSQCSVPSINCALYRALTYNNGTGGATNNMDGTQNMGVHGVQCFSLSACLSGSLAVGTLNVPVNLNFPLSNLKLSAQGVIPNCWGSTKFC